MMKCIYLQALGQRGRAHTRLAGNIYTPLKAVNVTNRLSFVCFWCLSRLESDGEIFMMQIKLTNVPCAQFILVFETHAQFSGGHSRHRRASEGPTHGSPSAPLPSDPRMLSPNVLVGIPFTSCNRRLIPDKSAAKMYQTFCIVWIHGISTQSMLCHL